jgi:hypothetical protein
VCGYSDINQNGFSVMVAQIKEFQVQSHTPDPAATLFYDEVGRLHQKKWGPELWPFNLLGSCSNDRTLYTLYHTMNPLPYNYYTSTSSEMSAVSIT